MHISQQVDLHTHTHAHTHTIHTQVLAKLPEAWFSEGVMMKVSLQGMDRYLEHLAEALDRSSIGHSDMERKKTKYVCVCVCVCVCKAICHIA